MTNVEKYHAALRSVGVAARNLADALAEVIPLAAGAPDGDDAVALEVVGQARRMLRPLLDEHPAVWQLLGIDAYHQKEI